MAGGFGSSGTARQDVTSWSEVVIRAPGILLSLLVHVPSCVRGLWNNRECYVNSKACTVVTATKGTLQDMSLSKGLCTLW